MTKDSRIDHTGSSFDSFLEEEGILNEANVIAFERVKAWRQTAHFEKSVLVPDSVEKLQREFCEKHRSEHCGVSGESMLGFAKSTIGKFPVNGMRHPLSDGFSGWYLWCGEFSDAADFFVPLHARHVYEDYPEIFAMLGLSPGHRFLVDGEYTNVWFDPSLLKV